MFQEDESGLFQDIYIYIHLPKHCNIVKNRTCCTATITLKYYNTL